MESQWGENNHEFGSSIVNKSGHGQVIVPDTELGERVTVEITDVQENLGFGKVVEREVYYD